jgi:hypothetical protein
MSADREKNGNFAKGNKCAAGRPKNSPNLTNILRSIAEELQPGKDHEIRTRLTNLMRDIWDDAEEGCKVSRQFIVDRMFGKVRELAIELPEENKTIRVYAFNEDNNGSGQESDSDSFSEE